MMTYMTTRVIIPQRLCASETFQQWIGCQNHILDLLDTAILSTRDGCNVLHNPLRGLRLSCPRFTRDNDTLILVVGVHIIVRAFCNTKDVRRDLQPVLSLVPLQYFVGIYTEIYEQKRIRNTVDNKYCVVHHL